MRILTCSRHGYEEAMWTQDRVHFLRAIEHALLGFGGVPEVLQRKDNLKAAIIRACLYGPDVAEPATGKLGEARGDIERREKKARLQVAQSQTFFDEG